MASTVDDVLQRLKASGARLTVPRRAVIEALVESGPHPTAEHLAALVGERHPDVHRSTVYRTLDALTEIGIISHVHLGHTGAVYHFRDDADLHVVCERCDAVMHVDARVLDGARAQIEEATGFLIDPGHFALPAICPACREPTGADPGTVHRET